METIELNINLAFGRKSVFLLMVLFFLCWRPGFLGSESLTLTTYYPAPYGGYVNILTTGQALLARDGGNVGIGTANPQGKLAIELPNDGWNGYDPIMKLSAWQDGGDNSGNGGAIDFYVNNQTSNYPSSRIIHTMSSGAGGELSFATTDNYTTTLPARRLVIKGNGQVGINTINPQQRLHVANGNISIETGDLMLSGNGLASGRITGLCTTYTYTAAPANTFCGPGERPVAHYGDGVPRVLGFLPASATTSGAGTYISLGQDWNGTMLCCRIP